MRLSPHRPSWAAPLLLVVLTLTGCGGPDSTSSKSRVMAKSGAVWSRDLAQGLGLETWELCSELGSYDCVEEAHRITLGGVEPTKLGIDDPLPNASVTAPIAVDRVAISACALRYERDQEGPAVVFGPVLDNDSKRAREDVAETLVERLLSRRANKDEIEALDGLHAELEASSSALTRDWAVGACVMVATSTEALFY